MLATGLLILKIIGLVLLGILGLILALILLVLLAPIRYRAEASYYSEAKAEASVNWLFHILSCKVVYNGELDMGIRVFGFPIKGKSCMEDEDEDETSKEQEKQLEAEILEELESDQREELRAGKEKVERGAADSGKRPKRKLRLKMPFSFQGICDKLKEIGRQKDKAVGFLKDEENQRTFRLLWRQAKALFHHVLPMKLRGKVRFGFDDPYTTGQVLTYISPFYGLYGTKFQVIPVFEEPVLEGEGWLCGRIRIGTVLFLGIRVFFDKNFRKLLRQWRI